jgi:CRP-like cAMP-binding protein
VQEKIFQKDEIIIKPGGKDHSLFKIISGKALTLVVQGSKVTPLFMHIPGTYLGSILFFLEDPEKTYSLVLEETSVIIYDQNDLNKNFPEWLKSMAISLAQKNYLQYGQIIEKGLKKSLSGVSPLSIEEQRRYLKILKLI